MTREGFIFYHLGGEVHRETLGLATVPNLCYGSDAILSEMCGDVLSL